MNERFTVVALIFLGAATIFIILNPFGWFTPEKQSMPELDEQTIESAFDELSQTAKQSSEAALQVFSEYPIVFIGELGGVKNETEFLSSLIPELAARGIRHLGLEHLLAADQELIDQLINAEVFDEYLAEQLLYNRLVTWGYQEYLELLHRAWEVNTSSQGPFRLIGLNIIQLYDHIESVEDFKDPNKLRDVMRKGNPDAFMASVIDHEFIQTGIPAAIFMDMEKTFPRFLLKKHAEEMQAISMPEVRQTAHILYEKYGDRFGTILFHSPWPTSLTNSRFQYPADGLFDAILNLNEKRGGEHLLPPLGFVVSETEVIARQTIESSNLSLGYNNEDSPSLRFEDMADAYIILDRIHNLQAATAIPGFIDDKREQYALQNFPGTHYKDADKDDINSFIQSFSQDRQELLSGFEE